MPFSTWDVDHDKKKTNCAKTCRGAWWYNKCHGANLNGEWGSREFSDGLIWEGVTGDYASATYTEIKFRQLH